MKSNYKKLGQFIREVSIKNKELKVDLLLGVSITKQFIPSIANTIGTDMSIYKIVKQKQFAYGPVTSRNGDKISVALLNEEECIISTSYTVFEVIDTNLLDPEYLMMWFRRSEFDRYARYMSHGTVRELFSWQEMCDVELPVPSIEKQREIVREYNVVNDRIVFNEQLIQKLEDTAQAIYEQWFVDFEFPISKEYAEYIGKPELEGQSYKSSGGSMKYCEDLGCEIPDVMNSIKLNKLVSINNMNFDFKNVGFSELQYLDTGSITKNHIEGFKTFIIGKDVIPSRARRKVTHNSIVYSTVRPNLCHYGLIKYPPDNLVVSTGFCVIHSVDSLVSNELILILISSERIINAYQSKAEMSVATYPSIKPEDILETSIPLPNHFFEFSLKNINKQLIVIFEYIEKLSKEKLMLIELKSLTEKNLANRF